MQLSPTTRRTVTTGLMLGISLGAMEATVVGTAMPTVIATLGGLDHYSWVFSAYLLTSTASVPIWGRLSDLYGRRRLYLIGIVFFLAGSALAGISQTMLQLIVFRAIQGLGAGALIPLSMTIIGEIYTLEERARMQAVFSGIWGVASVAGPLIGGYLTDALSWRWVFYINLPLGIVSTLIIGAAYPGHGQTRETTIDWTGALLLFAAVSALLAGLADVTVTAWPWFVAAVVLAALFAVAERRAAEPILPYSLFENRVLSWSLAVVFLLGMAMFGAIAFVPLFVQAVMGGSATEAGGALTPLFLGWVGTSILSARLIRTVGYRQLNALGIVLVAGAFMLFARMDASTARVLLAAIALTLGGGMGFSMLALLLAVQHAVGRPQLGLATSLNQFSRSIGAAIGVALMGALLSLKLGHVGGSELQAIAATGALASVDTVFAERLGSALRFVFAAGAGISALALIPAMSLPPVDFGAGVPASTGERMLAAEMTNLEPDDEPTP